MIREPEPSRMAIHQAGHAVVQTLVGKERFTVSRLTLGVEPNAAWPEHIAWGEATLDREILFSIYEFGLVTLAGFAAEERYLSAQPPEEEPLVALSDLAEWQEQARRVFSEPEKLNLVSLNIMHRLKQWFSEPEIWQTVEAIAEALLKQGELDQTELQRLLAQLPIQTTAVGG